MEMILDNIKNIELSLGIDNEFKNNLYRTINCNFLNELGIDIRYRVQVVTMINLMMVEHKTNDLDSILFSEDFDSFIESIK